MKKIDKAKFFTPFHHEQTLMQLTLIILLFVYQIKITKKGERATAMINDEEIRSWTINWEYGKS